MIGREQLERLWANLLGLGVRRLLALAVVGLGVFTAVGFGSYYLSRPDFETLYAGLNPQDVSRIGATLKEAGIQFDVSAEGTRVLVRNGQTAAGTDAACGEGSAQQRQLRATSCSTSSGRWGSPRSCRR